MKLNPLAIAIGGPLAIATAVPLALALTAPQFTLPQLLQAAVIALMTGLVILGPIAWAVSPRSLPNNYRAVNERLRSTTRYASLAMMFALGYMAAGVINKTVDKVFVMCCLVVFIGALAAMAVEARVEHWKSLECPPDRTNGI